MHHLTKFPEFFSQSWHKGEVTNLSKKVEQTGKGSN